MIIRNGIRSTLRARGRSALFTLLILLLTLSLTLGLGMWVYCAQTLAAMDEGYTSVALVEYMGADYPSADAADEYARQAAQALDGDAIAAIDGVELWEGSDQTLAALSGYQRIDGTLPYEDYAVVVATNFTPMYTDGVQWFDPEEFQLPDAAYALIDYETGEVTYCAPGLEPLTIPVFITLDGEVYRAVRGTGLDGTTETVFRSDDLSLYSEPYILDGSQVGDIPGEYIPFWTNVYQWDPIEGRYGVEGQVISGYSCSIVSSLYLPADQRDGVLAILQPGDTGFVPESGQRYLLHGAFTEGSSSNTTFTVLPFPEDGDTPPYLALSGLDDPARTEGIFADYAAYYEMVNSYICLEASGDIASLELFQQGALYLAQGRFPQAGEAGVCVIDGRTAGQLGLSLGDSVEVRPLTSAGDDRFALSGGEDVRSLEVVGITNAAEGYSGYLWVSDAEGGFGQPLFGYGLGRAVLDNALGRQAADALQALAPDGVRVTLYDQGYSNAAQPFQAMETTALAITAASAAGALAVLLLFGYLFVGCQRETVAVLSCLGTPAGKIRLWLLSGAVVIAGAAALVGALAGRLSMGVIIQAALSAAQGLYAVDQRYSEAAIGVAREAVEAGAFPWWPAAAAALAVFAVALLLCLAFLGLARRQGAPRRGKSSVRVPKGGTSVRGSGPVRFALLSLRRGGWRSGVVPAAALALALLLGILTSSAQGWDRQIQALYDTAALAGEVTSLNGRQSTNLSVPARSARLLWDSGLLSDLSVSIGWHYWLDSEMPDFGTSGFAAETRAAWIARQPELVALNGLSAAPAFYYVDQPQVEWWEDWDESFLADTEYYSILESMIGSARVPGGGKDWLVYPCLVSQSFLERQDLELGEAFEVMIQMDIMGDSWEMLIGLFPVGAYTGSGGQEELYVPLSFWCDPGWITGPEAPLAEGERPNPNFTDEAGRDAYYYWNTNFSTCRFTLASAYQLEDFRDYLEEQDFSQVGRITANRTSVVLRDQSFVETVGGLGRYVTFSRILLPALCAAVGLLGFIISWLMVNGRRMEFAILRGLGASRGRVFWSFFLEQGCLALLGCVLGGLVLTATGAGWAGWLAAAGFLVCYLAGCALAVLVVGRTHLMSLLSEQE